jgi:proline iminopeptidase
VHVSIGDVRLFVDVGGPTLVPDGSAMRERPTVIMLHGGPGIDHSPFKQTIFSPLTEIAQVIYYDQRGQGRSDRGSSSDWNLDTWADDVCRLCDALGVVRPIVFGGSFGGFVALNYARRHPNHPGKLILLSTAARTNPRRMCEMFERLGGPNVRAVAEQFLTNPTLENEDEYLRVCLPHYTQRPLNPDVLSRIERRHDVAEHFIRGEGLRFDLTEGLDRIGCPTLVMAGELDPAVPVGDARDLANALPRERTRFESFVDAGHMLAFEKPEAVMKVITAFVLEDL